MGDAYHQEEFFFFFFLSVRGKKKITYLSSFLKTAGVGLGDCKAPPESRALPAFAG